MCSCFPWPRHTCDLDQFISVLSTECCARYPLSVRGALGHSGYADRLSPPRLRLIFGLKWLPQDIQKWVTERMSRLASVRKKCHTMIKKTRLLVAFRKERQKLSCFTVPFIKNLAYSLIGQLSRSKKTNLTYIYPIDGPTNSIRLTISMASAYDITSLCSYVVVSSS